jgi:hypothetical protein
MGDEFYSIIKLTSGEEIFLLFVLMRMMEILWLFFKTQYHENN